MSKGSTRRPTNEKTYMENYDAIFGKKKEEASRDFEEDTGTTEVNICHNCLKIFMGHPWRKTCALCHLKFEGEE